jgi:hypothetical protein
VPSWGGGPPPLLYWWRASEVASALGSHGDSTAMGGSRLVVFRRGVGAVTALGKCSSAVAWAGSGWLHEVAV